MFTDIVEQMDMPQVRKLIFHEMAELYEQGLPDTLYMTHYKLEEEFGFRHEEWSQFLKIREINRLIEAEIAQIAEIGARTALQRLQSGQAQSADIQAARELLANSKLLKQKVTQREQFVITRVPPKDVNEHVV